jgi:hypothetical protein
LKNNLISPFNAKNHSHWAFFNPNEVEAQIAEMKGVGATIIQGQKKFTSLLDKFSKTFYLCLKLLATPF